MKENLTGQDGAVQNLKKLADHKGLSFASEKKSSGKSQMTSVKKCGMLTIIMYERRGIIGCQWYNL